MTWLVVAGGDRARARDDGLARAAARPAARLARAHRGHRVDLDDRRARGGAVAAARAVSSTRRRRRTSASRRRRGSSGSSSARSRSTTRSACAPTSRSTTRRRSWQPSAPRARPRSTRCPSSRAAARRRACGCTSTPRTRARRRCARSCAGVSTAAIASIRSSSTRTSGCSRRWTARRSGRAGPDVLQATFATSPDYLASTGDAVDLKDFGPALGRRFRALKLWFVLRMYGAEGLQALIREHVRLAQLFASWVEAEPGWEVVAPHPFSTVCFRHGGPRQLRARARRDGDRRAVRRRDPSARTGCDPARDRQRRARRRGGRAPRLGGAAWHARGDLRPLGDADRLGPGGGRADGRQDRRTRRAGLPRPLVPAAEPVPRTGSHGARRGRRAAGA